MFVLLLEKLLIWPIYYLLVWSLPSPVVNCPHLDIQDVINVQIQVVFVVDICMCHIPLFLQWPKRSTQLNNTLTVIRRMSYIWLPAMTVMSSMLVVSFVISKCGYLGTYQMSAGNLTPQISALSAHCISKHACSAASITFQEIERVNKPIRGGDYTRKRRGRETFWMFALQTCSPLGSKFTLLNTIHFSIVCSHIVLTCFYIEMLM